MMPDESISSATTAHESAPTKYNPIYEACHMKICYGFWSQHYRNHHDGRFLISDWERQNSKKCPSVWILRAWESSTMVKLKKIHPKHKFRQERGRNKTILRTTPKLNDIKEETNDRDWYINTALVRSYSTLPVWITFIDFILLDTSVGPQLESIRKASPFRSNLQRLYLVSIGRGPKLCWRGINLKTLGWLLYNLCWSKDNGKIFKKNCLVFSSSTSLSNFFTASSNFCPMTVHHFNNFGKISPNNLIISEITNSCIVQLLCENTFNVLNVAVPPNYSPDYPRTANWIWQKYKAVVQFWWFEEFFSHSCEFLHDEKSM